MRIPSGHMSMSAFQVFQTVGVSAEADGDIDIGGIRVEADTSDLRSPMLCRGGERHRASLIELSRIQTYIPHYRTIEGSNIVAAILFADNGLTVVYWSRGGECAFRDLDPQHLDVLRTMANSVSTPTARRVASISYSETVLSLAAIYGCEGSHKYACPRPGDRDRSLVNTDGSVNAFALAKLQRQA